MNARATTAAASLAVLISGLAPSAAPAQPPGAAVGSGGDAQCAYVVNPDPAVVAALMEGMLAPGRKLDLAGLMKDPKARAFLTGIAQQEQARTAKDWAALCRYKAADAEQAAKGAPRVVFLGDSITEFWGMAEPSLFAGGVIDRGISGQTTSQILLRVYADVVALHPAVVHLMAGTNDVAQNTGPISDADILNNISAMIDLAKANGVKVVLAAIPPSQVIAKPHAAERIAELDRRLRQLAADRKVTFVDYGPALSNGHGGLRAELSNDGLHPNLRGFALMTPIAQRAIAGALRSRSD